MEGMFLLRVDIGSLEVDGIQRLLVGTYVKGITITIGKVVRLVLYSGLRSIYLSERDTGEARILI